METWAYCGQCERWFYVPAVQHETATKVACPACERVPVRSTTMPVGSGVR